MSKAGTISIFLCGDVMTGRGIDQVLPYPVQPVLYEPYIQDAGEYVQLAEAVNGPIARPVEFPYIWGDALEELQRFGPDAHIVNLETSITRNDRPWPKGINYRMSPRNVGSLTAAHIDCCCLANNHVLDWDYAGLMETLGTLEAAGISHAGAGLDAARAAAPAVLDLADKGRVLVFGFGSTTSGIPLEWSATDSRPGLNVLRDVSEDTAWRIAEEIHSYKRPGDVAVASIHWGGNWGYEVPAGQIDFAHRLVEGGVDLIHGHSSHHVKAIEVYREHLILYGCGDFITDYEGISGYEAFRGDLAMMYLVKVDLKNGHSVEVRLVPMQSRRFRLHRVAKRDAQWLCDLLNDLGSSFATHIELTPGDSMALRCGP